MSGSGRGALPDVREWSGGNPGSPEGVGRPSVISWIDLKALPVVREWSAGSPECPGVVGKPTLMSGSRRE